MSEYNLLSGFISSFYRGALFASYKRSIVMEWRLIVCHYFNVEMGEKMENLDSFS